MSTQITDHSSFTMASAVVNPLGILESLFRPSTRFRGGRKTGLAQNFTEVEFLPHLSTEDILARGITWNDFRRFAHDKLVWMTPGAYIISSNHHFGGLYPIAVEVGAKDDSAGMCVRVRPGATTTQTASATCNFLIRLLASSDKRAVYMKGSSRPLLPISGPTLSQLFKYNRGNLREVTLRDMIFNEEHIRVLASAAPQELELVLRACRLSDDEACRNAFRQWLQSGGGPTELYRCVIDSDVLSDAMRGNSRLGKLLLSPEKASTADDSELSFLVSALAENKGLKDFDAFWYAISDENWSILCHSVQNHPTLTNLDLACTGPKNPDGKRLFSEEQKTNRTLALAEMMQTNTILHTIRLFPGEFDERIFAESIQPRLQANLHRPRVLAIKKEADDRSFRQKVLGRALSCVSSNPDHIWMFLSENMDAFSSCEEQKEGVATIDMARMAAPSTVSGSKRKRCSYCTRTIDRR
jgi:hypothetical protein